MMVNTKSQRTDPEMLGERVELLPTADFERSVFAFERQLVVPSEDGTTAHAQLSFGNGMVMLGSVSKVENELDRLNKQPDEIGGMETQSPYIIMSDADSIYQRAKAAGARIEVEIKDEDDGGRGFSCCSEKL